MPPFLGGGEMIRDVRLDGFTCNDLPWKFEAGTMPIIEAVGLHAAIDYLDALGLDAVRAHEVQLSDYARSTLQGRLGDSLRIYGPPTRPSAAGWRRSPTATCTPTTSPRCSTSTPCASGPATTAPSR